MNIMHNDKTCNERVTLVTKMRVSMTGNCNRNSGAHVQGGWRLDSECLSLPHYLAQSGLSTPSSLPECPPHSGCMALSSLAGACLCQFQYPLHGSLLYY